MPTDKQLTYIETLMGKRGNGHFSDAFAEISRATGASQKKATKADASRTIDILKQRKIAA